MKEKSKSEKIRDEIIEREDDEEDFLKNDAVGKFMFNYNRTTAMSDDVPEMNAPDAPVIIQSKTNQMTQSEQILNSRRGHG